MTIPCVRRIVGRVAWTGAACLLTGCAGSDPGAEPRGSASAADIRTTSSDAGTPRTIESGGVIRDVRPWSLGEARGQAVTTDRFVLYVTERDPMISQRLPGFMEAALDHYTRALGSLPPPPDRLETFVCSGRAQWQKLVLSMVGPQAQAAINAISRGGLTLAGRAYLFDIGSAETLNLASHEGWHQYTQRTLADTLPIWLEEGIATYMEGHLWRGSSVTFAGWANIERFDELRRASASGHILPLTELLSTSPNRLVERGQSEEALTYYAQVWALVHFLHEGEDGRRRAGLQTLLQDAAVGRLQRVVNEDMASRGVRPRRPESPWTGTEAFVAYFGPDLNRASAEYRAFIARVVQTGSRQAIVEGRSPLGSAP